MRPLIFSPNYWQQHYKNLKFLDNSRLIHSFKTAFACLIGLALEKYFHWQMGQWVPITIMVVMSAQAHFGAALQKSYMRFLGTLAGVIIAAITILFFANNIWAMFIVVFCAGAFFAYIASGGGNISYAGTLGGVTVILTLTATNATVAQAITRGIYIIIGIIIALLVSRFIFPIHAREKLRHNIAQTLRNLSNLYAQTIQETSMPTEPINKEEKFSKIIVENLNLAPQLIEEAAAGSHYFTLHHKKLYSDMTNNLRKIYRLIFFMQKSLEESSSASYNLHKIGALENMHHTIENIFNNFAANIENGAATNNIVINFAALLDMITTTTAKLPACADVQKLLDEHSFLFLLEQLIKELQTTYNLVDAINKNNNI